jgi:peptidyl-dipeptidase A
MRDWVEGLVERVKPLEIAVNRAWWDAAVTGSPADYERLERFRNELDDVFRDPTVADSLVRGREAPPDDPAFARSIELLWLEALPRQVDAALSERINRLATEIERDFAIYRPCFEGSETSQNDLEEVLARETDESRLREAWEALKTVGPRVAPRLRELVDLRNTAARAVGHDDFWRLKLALGEQDPAAVGALFDRLDALTAEPFRALKDEIDERLAARLAIEPGGLRPWHYQDPFFQGAPAVFGVDLDGFYGTVDLLDVARRFFSGVGLEVTAILESSSLYEAPGKDPHAFATDIDREGDVRILLNLRPNERWMGTTLHELGHAVYDAGIDPALPWLLRRPAHTVTTEAMAMLFGRLSKSADWMRDMGIVGVDDAEALREPTSRELRAHMLAFSRWAQVMMRFERGLYSDPDQDLDALWWSLIERYQLVERPDRPAGAADWASKIHIVAAPVYYHNYLLGECFASQVDAALRAEVLVGEATYCANAAVGEWLAEHVFRPGARWHYDELSRRATGTPIAPEAFAEQFLAEVPR